MSSER